MYENMSKTTGILDICAPVATLHWYSFDKVWYLQWFGMVWFGICNGMVWYDIECAFCMVWYDYGVECAHVSPFMPLLSTYPAF